MCSPSRSSGSAGFLLLCVDFPVATNGGHALAVACGLLTVVASLAAKLRLWVHGPR